MERRFKFGDNWKSYLDLINKERITNAQHALGSMLKLESLSGIRFLDVGSGSGLSSLSALNLGAEVTSFDYDQESVEATKQLKEMFASDSNIWSIEVGSVLDRQYMQSLGKFDIVYSWGVLHHTGRMWNAIDNCIEVVEDNGVLFIAIYNDQGLRSHIWWILKYIYNIMPAILKKPYALVFGMFVKLLLAVKNLFKLPVKEVLKPFQDYKSYRGMSMMHDLIEWYGGFPYEFATYETLIDYIEANNFKLINGKANRSSGCHELVFKRVVKI